MQENYSNESDQIASSAKDCKKNVGGEITKKWEQISKTKKIFNAWTYHLPNIPELSFDVRMQPFLTCFGVII